MREFLDPQGLNAQQQRVCGHLLSCHTEARGGLTARYDACGAEQPRYRSCGDRHCPQCQGRATEAWTECQRGDQLPVAYFHLVFTLPHRLNPWVQSHPEVIYRALFHAAWATLDAFGHDAKRLGGQLGMTGVLHTWGQIVCQHVHLHGLVPGGALMAEDWVVYAKPGLAHTESVIGSLARYTHRIAISNARLLALDDDQVSLSDRDGGHKTLTLDAPELIRRFLLHVLPKGLMRVRHYGLLGNRCRVQPLAQICETLAVPVPEPTPTADPGGQPEPGWPCPVCRRERMRPLREIAPRPAALGCAPYR